MKNNPDVTPATTWQQIIRSQGNPQARANKFLQLAGVGQIWTDHEAAKTLL